MNTAFPFAAAYLLSAGVLDVRFWIGTLFFLVPYNFAMYGINDVFDYESDLRNPRKGGVEGAVLDRRLHRITLWGSVLLCVPFVAYLVSVGSPAASSTLAVSLFAVAAYSWRGLRFKEIPFLDSLTSSTHFASPAVYALVLTGASWNLSLVLVLLAFFCWGIASHAFGAVQDIQADRQAGLGSIATVLGARATSRFALALYGSAGLSLALASMTVSQNAWILLVVAVCALPYVAMVWPFRSLSDDNCEQANRGWRRFLAINFGVGLVVTLAMFASVQFR
ncbi:MAG TPA: prenyltransferase [Microbacteriaceae bacterium]|nr:prenyltransferase [Microbacteriaceae bacterium]